MQNYPECKDLMSASCMETNILQCKHRQMQDAGLLFVMMIVTHGGYGKETVSHTLLIEKKVEPLASRNWLNHERSSLRGQDVYFVYI